MEACSSTPWSSNTMPLPHIVSPTHNEIQHTGPPSSCMEDLPHMTMMETVTCIYVSGVQPYSTRVPNHTTCMRLS